MTLIFDGTVAQGQDAVDGQGGSKSKTMVSFNKVETDKEIRQ